MGAGLAWVESVQVAVLVARAGWTRYLAPWPADTESVSTSATLVPGGDARSCQFSSPARDLHFSFLGSGVPQSTLVGVVHQLAPCPEAVPREFLRQRPFLQGRHGYHRHLAAALTALMYLHQAQPAGQAAPGWVAEALAVCRGDEEELRRRVLW